MTTQFSRFPSFSPYLKTLVLTVFLTAGAGVFFLFPVKPAHAAGDDVRRLSAEIVVMAADGRRLAAPDLSGQHRIGLKARLRGGLAVLPLLIGAARNDAPSLPALEKGRIGKIQSAVDKNDTTAIIEGLSLLAATYPFDTTGLLPPDTRTAAVGRAKSLHQTYCASCHDDPDLDKERPAWNLFALARSAPAIEIAARLVIGVRGDGLTGLDNPLRNAEISALIAFYLGDNPKRASP